MCAMRTVLRMNGRASPDALWGLYSEISKPPSKCAVDDEVQSAAASSAQQRRRLLAASSSLISNSRSLGGR